MSIDVVMKTKEELNPGEVLLWSGQPATGIRLRAADLYQIPFSLLWGGFACAWEGGVLTAGITFFALWGIPFVVVGNYMIWGRFLADAWQRSKTHYAVTNQRIIIASGLLSYKVKSLNLRTLTDVSMDQRSDGSGNLTFGPSHPFSYHRISWPGTTQQTPGFEMIPNVREVYKLIQDAQRAA